MIELGKTATAQTDAAATDAIRDATDQTFMAEVVEASRDVPVIVDFWAPWCGPCKQLTPALEDAVRATKGKVRLVKVNVDENQMVASQLRVQSIPTVYAFVGGQPVDGFQGALPASQVAEFVSRLAEASTAHSLEDVIAACEQLLDEGAYAEAHEGFAGILAEDPKNARAHAGLIRVHVATGDLDKAKLVLSKVPAEIETDAAIAAARSAIEIAEATAGAGEAEALRERLAANADDHEARFELATALMAKGDAEGAIDELLELFRRDREWNEEAAKTQLMKLFESLGPQNPAVGRGRRRLSSMIFA